MKFEEIKAPTVTPDLTQRVPLRELQLGADWPSGILIVAGYVVLGVTVGFFVSLNENKPFQTILIGAGLVFAGVIAVFLFPALFRRRTHEILRRRALRASEDARIYLRHYAEGDDRLPALVSELEPCIIAGSAALETHRVASFWDNVDNAYHCLTAIESGMRGMKKSAEKYYECLAGYGHTFPQLTLSLPIERLVMLSKRYDALLRQADESPQFISIFEQRRGPHAPFFRYLTAVTSQESGARAALVALLSQHEQRATKATPFTTERSCQRERPRS